MLFRSNEEGLVDIETLKEEFSRQLGAEGMMIQFPLIGGITFYKNDIDKLYQYIMNS